MNRKVTKETVIVMLGMLIFFFISMRVASVVKAEAIKVDEIIKTEYDIDEPYEYPIVPGTDEWKTFTSNVQKTDQNGGLMDGIDIV